MKNIKILIVADQRDTSKKLKTDLKKMGLRITSIVDSKEDVIAGVKNDRPDLALVDITLKGVIDGIEAVKLIQLEFDIPVVYLASFTDPALFKIALKVEPFGFLIKPFEADELNTTIKTAIHKHNNEKELKQSKHSFELLDRISPVGIWRADAAGNNTYINDRCSEFIGLKSEDASGAGWTKYIHPDDKERSYKKWMDCVQNNKPFNLELRFCLPGNKIIFALAQAETELDRNGNVVSYVGTLTDITNVKKIEEDLLFSKFTIENNADATFWIKSDPTIIYANKAACRILEYSLEEFLSFKVYDIDPDFPKESWHVHWQEMKEAGSLTFEAHHKTKGGRVFPVEIQSTFIEFKEGGYICAFARDISARKKVEGKIRLHGQIVDNMAEGVQLVRANDNSIVYANKRFGEMFGYENGKLIGKHVSVLNAPGDRTSTDVAESIARELKCNGTWAGEIQNIKSDGSLFWCYAAISGFNHPDYGDVWVSVHEDITIRKQAEEALRVSEARARRLIESNIIGIILADFNGRILEANDAFLNMVGYSRKELLSGTVMWTEMTPPEYRYLDEQAIKQLKKTGKSGRIYR